MGKVWPISRLKELTPKEIKQAIPYPEDSPRPSEMDPEDCQWEGSPRPCPLVSCRYNNYLNVKDNGTILLTWPGKRPDQIDPEKSCALDVAKRGQTEQKPLDFRELGEIINCTYQNVQHMFEAISERAKKMMGEDENE